MYINHIYEYDFYEMLNTYKKANFKDNNYKKLITTKIIFFIMQIIVALMFFVAPHIVNKFDQSLDNNSKYVILIILTFLASLILFLIIWTIISFILMIVSLKTAFKNEKTALKIYRYHCIMQFNFSALKPISNNRGKNE
ncbi:hypothetical protein VBM87_00935 [Mycoplasma sp. 744]|uniref:hypothetical protein n=1 Tax=Mycoplasma sp. 744 TaxID=3108531 RepID=UPI002B1CF3B3|nr:hypothetical protein [Mycoplasma sp. 744]MEA4115350.1 hypothetical protein [Mycoplasma sp. 744]